jgi:hypothetical protein
MFCHDVVYERAFRLDPQSSIGAFYYATARITTTLLAPAFEVAGAQSFWVSFINLNPVGIWWDDSRFPNPQLVPLAGLQPGATVTTGYTLHRGAGFPSVAPNDIGGIGTRLEQGTQGIGIGLASEYVVMTSRVVAPEPGTWVLLGTGLLALGGVAARRKRTTV